MLTFFFYCYAARRDLHSFPTRRSSDLVPTWPGGKRRRRADQIAAVLPVGAWHRVSAGVGAKGPRWYEDRKSTRLNSSHLGISYAVFCLKKKKKKSIINYLMNVESRTAH